MTAAERVLAETRVSFWDVDKWMTRHPAYLSMPHDVVALVLEERGINRDSVRAIYPDPIASSLDYIIQYESTPVAAPRPGAGEEK